MANVSGPLSILTGEEMNRIHSTAIEILETVGMKIDNYRALDYLEAAGCTAKRGS